MDPLTLGLLGVAGMFALIALHIPIGVAMGMAGFVGVGALIGWGPALSLFSTEPMAILVNEDLAVVPLFLLMGSLASVAGLSSDIYRLAAAFLGHRRGGLALTTIGGCAGFGAVCGSSIATAATMTRVALPEMLERNYQPMLAAGSIAAGGTLGMLIPPSILMVLYAVLTEQFVITLFVAAIVPGLLAVLLYFAAIMIHVRINPTAGPPGPRRPWRERWVVVRQSWGVIVLAVTVSGGIYSGVFTVSEAAAVGAVGALVFTILRRRLTAATLWQALSDTASSTALIYLIIFGASIFTYFVTLSQMSSALVDVITSVGPHPLLVMFLLMIMYVVLGSVFDTVAAMVITLPFVFPLILALGYDPIWFGVVMVMVMELGMITPPIGINVFVVHGMAKTIPLTTIFRGVLPFVSVDILRLAILVLVPGIALWLPGVLGMPN